MGKLLICSIILEIWALHCTHGVFFIKVTPVQLIGKVNIALGSRQKVLLDEDRFWDRNGPEFAAR